jgi:hypothetical protein
MDAGLKSRTSSTSHSTLSSHSWSSTYSSPPSLRPMKNMLNKKKVQFRNTSWLTFSNSGSSMMAKAWATLTTKTSGNCRQRSPSSSESIKATSLMWTTKRTSWKCSTFPSSKTKFQTFSATNSTMSLLVSPKSQSLSNTEQPSNNSYNSISNN